MSKIWCGSLTVASKWLYIIFFYKNIVHKNIKPQILVNDAQISNTRISGPYGPFKILAPVGGKELARFARKI